MTDDPKKIKRVMLKLHKTLKEEGVNNLRVKSIVLNDSDKLDPPSKRAFNCVKMPDGSIVCS